MNRTIEFEITIGSHWEDHSIPEHIRYVKFPEGGEHQYITIEFETDNVDPMKDAEAALHREMSGKEYHIWYWWWIK